VLLLILKIILIIFGIILLFLAGILFIPFTIRLQAGKKDKDIQIQSRASWISWFFSVKASYKKKRFHLYLILFGIPIKLPVQKSEDKKKKEKNKCAGIPRDEREKDEKKGEKERKPPSEIQQEADTGREDETIRDKYTLYFPFLKLTVLPQIRKMKRYLHLRLHRLDLSFGSHDPAVTGYVEGGISAFYPFIQNYTDQKNVTVRLIYYKSTLDFYVDLYFSMNLYGIVIRLLIIWWQYRKQLSSQRRISHESNTGETPR
jgi:hypothetical protein